MTANPLTEDLDHILSHTQGLWEELRGQRIFITGGTGFFGCWLLESFAWANDKLELNAEAVVLTRNPEAFYGRQPPEMTHISETYGGGPDPLDPKWAYGEGKRAAEMLCSLYARGYGLEPKIARCFAFVGPYLPLDSHFAVGNFIRDALKGGPIVVKGDGTPYRSYLYAADLAIWLWTILARGRICHPYNVGCHEGVPIKNVADHVAKLIGGISIHVVKQLVSGQKSERYVPDVARAGTLSLTAWIGLEEALRRTIKYYREIEPR